LDGGRLLGLAGSGAIGCDCWSIQARSASGSHSQRPPFLYAGVSVLLTHCAMARDPRRSIEATSCLVSCWLMSMVHPLSIVDYIQLWLDVSAVS
jgi:hypothetical protein